MRFKAIIRIIGFILMLFSVSVVVPIMMSLIYHDGATGPFVITGVFELALGFLGWFPLRNYRQQLKTRDGFLVVTLVWVVLSTFAALPFYLTPEVGMNVTDAFFEAVSGLTTTGATIISGIQYLPHAILFYRQELQFLGGMGIVVLAVAVLPLLGIGGMQLYRAETPGPMKDSKLTPRITETAKALWFIYIILTATCAFSYWVAGMTVFDAIGESFSTIATGGFAMHDSSFAFYHSNAIDIICMLFMFLSGISFALHYTVFQRRRFLDYWYDVEFRYFVWIIITVAVITLSTLMINHVYPSFEDDVMHGLFTVISLATTTGFTNSKFSAWPTFLPVLLMWVGMVGACGGSTAGGIKVMRCVLLCKQSMREMKRLIHPNAVYLIKFGKQALPIETIEAMWGFIGIFIATFAVLTLVLMALGMNLLTAFSAVVDTLANVGVGIDGVSDSFEHIGAASKWVLTLSMIAGRLEIFTLLLLFTPAFWQK
jgi:trk system potassium uptake protein TrkH